MLLASRYRKGIKKGRIAPFETIHAEFGEQMLSDERYRELLLNCSLVVGLHPDQATELIVDFALKHGKPFAVVPCCVFPALFPHRRLVHTSGDARASLQVERKACGGVSGSG